MDDEEYYQTATEELQTGKLVHWLWLKALVESDNDEIRAKVLYTKWRVQQLIKAEDRRQIEDWAPPEWDTPSFDTTRGIVLFVLGILLLASIVVVAFQ